MGAQPSGSILLRLDFLTRCPNVPHLFRRILAHIAVLFGARCISDEAGDARGNNFTFAVPILETAMRRFLFFVALLPWLAGCSSQDISLKSLQGSWYTAKGCQQPAVFLITDSTAYYPDTRDSLPASVHGDSLRLGDRTFHFALLGDTLRLSLSPDQWDYLRDECPEYKAPVQQTATPTQLEGTWYFKCQAEKNFLVMDGEFLYNSEPGFEMLVGPPFEEPLREALRVSGDTLAFGDNTYTYTFYGDTLLLTPDEDSRMPEQDYPLLYTRKSCGAAPALPKQCGRPDADACKKEADGIVQRYTYADYVVLTYPHGDGNGEDILVRSRVDGKTLYHAKDEDAFFAGMVGPVLLQDNGTGSQRTVVAYHLKNRGQKSWSTSGGIDSLQGQRLRLLVPMEAAPNPAPACPQASEWGSNTAWGNMLEIDLASLQATGPGQPSCYYQE